MALTSTTTLAQLSSELTTATALQNLEGEQEMLTYEEVQALVDEYDTHYFASAVDVFVRFGQTIDESVPKDEVIEFFEEYGDYGTEMEQYFEEIAEDYGTQVNGEFVFSVYERLANDDMAIHMDDLHDWVLEEGLKEAGAWTVWWRGLMNAIDREGVGADPDLIDGFSASQTIFEAAHYQAQLESGEYGDLEYMSSVFYQLDTDDDGLVSWPDIVAYTGDEGCSGLEDVEERYKEFLERGYFGATEFYFDLGWQLGEREIDAIVVCHEATGKNLERLEAYFDESVALIEKYTDIN